MFATVPSAENTTTAIWQFLKMPSVGGNILLALTNTINAKKDNIIIFIISTILILRRYFPGYFPPIEADLQGMPNASPFLEVYYVVLFH